MHRMKRYAEVRLNSKRNETAISFAKRERRMLEGVSDGIRWLKFLSHMLAFFWIIQRNILVCMKRFMRAQ